MRNLCCTILTVMISFTALCQTTDSISKPARIADKPVKTKVYRVNYFVSGAIIAVGMGGDIIAIPRLKHKATLTNAEVEFASSPDQVDLLNTVDRWALKQPAANRTMWRKISDDGEIGIFLLPSLLMIDKNIRKDWLHLLFMYVEGHTVTFTFYNYSPLGPFFQNRLRPAVWKIRPY